MAGTSAGAKKAWQARKRGGGVIGRANARLSSLRLGRLALHSMKTQGKYSRATAKKRWLAAQPKVQRLDAASEASLRRLATGR